jgi:hypothetical protein
MSNGEKDKLGEKLHDVEAARENEWARKRDQELIEKLRHAKHHSEAAHANDESHPQPAAFGSCPECKQELVPNTDQRIGGMICPQRHGAWFGWDTVARIMNDFAHTKK